MKGKSHQILEFLFRNRGAHTNEEILKNITLENETDKISKTLYDMKKKRGFVSLVGADKYRITQKGCNHAVISYGLTNNDLPLPIKPSPAKKLIGADIPVPTAFDAVIKDNVKAKPTIVEELKEIQGSQKKVTLQPSLKGDLEKALELKSKGDFRIVDLDQKLEVLGVISKLVDDKLSYWLEEIKKDLQGN